MTDNKILMFDYKTCPLDGRTIIEAAAGTGKTYNIERIALRLIVEKGIGVQELVLVTYTKAAASELRERINAILSNMREQLSGNSVSDDAHELLEVMRENLELDIESFREIAMTRLNDAIRDFASAPIGTIHAFCARILRENAFESRTLFRSELGCDTANIVNTCVSDCMRALKYNPETGFIHSFLLEHLGSYGKTTLNPMLKYENLEVIFESIDNDVIADFIDPENATIDDVGKALLAIFERLPNSFTSNDFKSWSAVCGTVFTDLAFAKVETAIKLDNYNIPSSSILGICEKYTLKALLAKKKKSVDDEDVIILSRNSFFRLCAGICELLKLWRKCEILHVYSAVSAGLKKYKIEENIVSFDDLLILVRDALNNSEKLLFVLRNKYKAGIIDEFQDTDPVQYEIFSKIFGTPRHSFFMVGDPRQAIYGFRGGDLATYLAAVRENSERPDGRKNILCENYRSSRNTVESVNRIFADMAYPFADSRIDFPKVLSPESAKGKGEIALDGIESETAMRVFEVDSKCDVYEYSASLAVSLLKGNYTLPDGNGGCRKLKPSDIAVLVSSGYEAQMIRNALSNKGISAVAGATVSVYATDEALELYTVMRAICDPSDRLANARALITKICGFTLYEIANMNSNDEKTENAIVENIFLVLRDIWDKRSFAAMMRELMERFNIYGRFGTLQDGERHLANLLQLTDLLQELVLEHRCGAPKLTNMLNLKIREAQSSQGSSDEELVRLETDRDCVRISTIHKSKGLEYPFVILPSLHRYYGKKSVENQTTYHIDDKHIAINPFDKDNPSYTELFKERLRLAYVALTRAKYGCFMFYNTEAKESSYLSPSDWLFRKYIVDDTLIDDEVAFRHFLKGMPYAPLTIPAEFKTFKIIEKSDRYIEDIPPEKECVFTEWNCNKIATWRRISFSAIVSGGHISGDTFAIQKELADKIAEKDILESGEEQIQYDLLSLPRGAAFGNAIHSIMEKIDFTASRENGLEIAKRELAAFGFTKDDDNIAEKVTDMIDDVLQIDLGGFTLGNLSRRDRISETEFDFSCSPFNSAQVKEILEDYAYKKFAFNDWQGIASSNADGMMKGFIDLIFRHDGRYFILDWKTNSLDIYNASFDARSLALEMGRNMYFLQYLIYCSAFMKYLFSRLAELAEHNIKNYDDFAYAYEKYFGGVYYIFMRGVPAGKGIFFERPEAELAYRFTNLFLKGKLIK